LARNQSTDVASGARGVRASLVVGLLLLVCAAVAAIVVALASAGAERWAAHSLEVRRVQAVTFSALQDAETAQRGYLLTADPAYLQPYNEAHDRLPILKDQLRGLVADNAAQRQRVADITQAIDTKMAELDLTVAMAREGRGDAAIARLKTNVGKAQIASARSAGHSRPPRRTCSPSGRLSSPRSVRC
jgi:CHASE3 domain sensor protein